MPTLLYARAPRDEREDRQVRKLARSAHAPADWIWHARMLVRSWEGWRTSAIATALGCHIQTVRERLHACNERGLDGLGSKPGGGRKPRSTEAERSAVIALVASPQPPSRSAGDVARWDRGARSQRRRRCGHVVARRAGGRGSGAGHRHRAQPGAPPAAPRRGPLAAHPLLGQQHGQGGHGFRPTSTAVVTCSTDPPAGATTRCLDELGPVTPRAFPPAPGWSPSGHRSKAPLG
jgi:Homeodomain-like domain